MSQECESRQARMEALLRQQALRRMDEEEQVLFSSLRSAEFEEWEELQEVDAAATAFWDEIRGGRREADRRISTDAPDVDIETWVRSCVAAAGPCERLYVALNGPGRRWASLRTHSSSEWAVELWKSVKSFCLLMLPEEGSSIIGFWDGPDQYQYFEVGITEGTQVSTG